jgi:formylmethanofuran dehydrogenase subunit C
MGGRGGPIEGCGRIIVDGNISSRMGISMLRGTIYVSGRVEEPLGNVIEVQSDLNGYRKFISITESLEKNIVPLPPNTFSKNRLTIADGIPRDTLAARNTSQNSLFFKGNAGMSTGILMQNGLVEINGDTDRNTGVLMRGGRLIIKGNTGDFTAAEMKGGEIFVKGDAGSFACAKMKGGTVYAKSARPIPPSKPQTPSSTELANLSKVLEINPLYAMMYRKYRIQ